MSQPAWMAAYWTKFDGTTVKISKMEDRHLINAIRMMRRNFNLQAYQHSVPPAMYSLGEVAQDSLDDWWEAECVRRMNAKSIGDHAEFRGLVAEHTRRCIDRWLAGGYRRVVTAAVEIETGVAGVSFRPDYPHNLQFADTLSDQAIVVWLERQQDNQFDPNAVAVHMDLGEMWDTHVGFIPAKKSNLAAKLAKELDAGATWGAEFVQVDIDPDHPDRPGLTIRLRRVG